MNIIYSECMTTILRKKSEVSHRHYKVIQILGLSPTQKAVSVTRFDHVMGSKVQWAYLTCCQKAGWLIFKHRPFCFPMQRDSSSCFSFS